MNPSFTLTTLERVAGWGADEWAAFRRGLIKILVVTNLVLGAYYLLWRGTASLNWDAWLFSLALFGAELYSYISNFFVRSDRVSATGTGRATTCTARFAG